MKIFRKLLRTIVKFVAGPFIALKCLGVQTNTKRVVNVIGCVARILWAVSYFMAIPVVLVVLAKIWIFVGIAAVIIFLIGATILSVYLNSEDGLSKVTKLRNRITNNAATAAT